MDHVGGNEAACVPTVPLFQALTHQQQVEVAGVARPTRVARGETIYAADEDVSQLMVVHDGRVKITRLTTDGHEQLLRVLGPGDFVGESAFLSGGRPDHFATAMEAASMCVFRHRDLERLVQDHPSIGLRMLQAVSRRLDESDARLVAVTSLDVEARLARYLVDLPATHGEDGSRVRLPLAKKDIAALLDTTPESLSRQLGRLRAAGVIAQPHPRELTILDGVRLMELAAQD